MRVGYLLESSPHISRLTNVLLYCIVSTVMGFQLMYRSLSCLVLIHLLVKLATTSHP